MSKMRFWSHWRDQLHHIQMPWMRLYHWKSGWSWIGWWRRLLKSTYETNLKTLNFFQFFITFFLIYRPARFSRINRNIISHISSSSFLIIEEWQNLFLNYYFLEKNLKISLTTECSRSSYRWFGKNFSSKSQKVKIF